MEGPQGRHFVVGGSNKGLLECTVSVEGSTGCKYDAFLIRGVEVVFPATGGGDGGEDILILGEGEAGVGDDIWESSPFAVLIDRVLDSPCLK